MFANLWGRFRKQHLKPEYDDSPNDLQPRQIALNDNLGVESELAFSETIGETAMARFRQSTGIDDALACQLICGLLHYTQKTSGDAKGQLMAATDVYAEQLNPEAWRSAEWLFRSWDAEDWLRLKDDDDSFLAVRSDESGVAVVHIWGRQRLDNAYVAIDKDQARELVDWLTGWISDGR
jgi:hypothetical protein